MSIIDPAIAVQRLPRHVAIVMDGNGRWATDAQLPAPRRANGRRRYDAAILDRLAVQGQDTGIFERHLAVEEALTGSPLTTGNQVLLLQDGPATYQAMFAAIESARDHINLETYILDDDEVGQRFAQARAARIVVDERAGAALRERMNPAAPIAHLPPWPPRRSCATRATARP